MTGVFDTVAAGGGNVDVRVASGDLGINLLAGHDITAFTPGLLSLTRVSSGGDYALTAADFGGDALHPVFGTSGAACARQRHHHRHRGRSRRGQMADRRPGDIHVEARGKGDHRRDDPRRAGRRHCDRAGHRLGQVTGRDVTIDAGTGTADMVGTVSVGRDYTLAGGDFVGNILAVGGARAGSLAVTDTVGDFDHGAADFAFGGAISIRAQHGLLRIGNLQAEHCDHAPEAGGDLELASAALTGTGAALSLTAGEELVFGAADCGFDHDRQCLHQCQQRADQHRRSGQQRRDRDQSPAG